MSGKNRPARSRMFRPQKWFGRPVISTCIPLLIAFCWGAIGFCQDKIPSRPVVERIRLLPGGFEPAEIKLASGNVFLAIDDRTHAKNVTFLLSAEGAPGASQTALAPLAAKGALKLRKQLNLLPGVYRITVPSRKEWVCRIVVEGIGVN